MAVITVSAITGTIVSAQGEPRIATKVQFVPLTTPYVVEGDIITSLVTEVTTSGSGTLALNLAYGTYRVLVGDSDAFNICVPADGAAYTLTEILCSPLPVVALGEDSSSGSGAVISADTLLQVMAPSRTIKFSRSGDPYADRTRIAVIGSYGLEGANATAVAALVDAWGPTDIITTGDNNYPTGQSSTIDDNVGKLYQAYIGGYIGGYGAGSDTNHFWPVPGDADWGAVIGAGASIQPYLDYFPELSNQTYYKQTLGDCEFFFIDSDKNEPNGYSNISIQAQWLEAQLAASVKPWKVVVFHHAPFSSVTGYVDNWMADWDLAGWGANVVLTGHARAYERIIRDGVTYINVGNSGQAVTTFGAAVSGSQARSLLYGACLVEANTYSMKVRMCGVDGVVYDEAEIIAPATSSLTPYVNVNRNKGLKVTSSGLEVDFVNMGYIQSLFSSLLAQFSEQLASTSGAYIYVGYATSEAGANFSTVFDNTKTHIAFKNSAVPILAPSASDFAGLWKNFSGTAYALAHARTIVVDENATQLAAAGIVAYATMQEGYDAAVTMAIATNAKVLISVGVGELGGITLTAAWDTRVEIEGRGTALSRIAFIGASASSSAIYPIDMRANNCRIESVNASPLIVTGTDSLDYGEVTGVVNSSSDFGELTEPVLDVEDLGSLTGGSLSDFDGKDVTINGSVVIGTVDARGVMAEDGKGGNITLGRGVVVTSVLTGGYPINSSYSRIVLTGVEATTLTTPGGAVSATDCIIGTINTSFNDSDGNYPAGSGGDVSLSYTSCGDITTTGTAYAGGTGPQLRPPLKAGDVHLSNFSTAAAITATSVNGEGGAVSLVDSVCSGVNTSSTGNIVLEDASVQRAGSVYMQRSVALNITATSVKASGGVVSLLNSQAADIVITSATIGGTLKCTESIVNSCLLDGTDGNGGIATLYGGSIGTLRARSTNANGGTLNLTNTNVTAWADVSSTNGTGGVITGLNSVIANIDLRTTAADVYCGRATLSLCRVTTINFLAPTEGYSGELVLSNMTYLKSFARLPWRFTATNCVLDVRADVNVASYALCPLVEENNAGTGRVPEFSQCKLLGPDTVDEIIGSTTTDRDIKMFHCIMNLPIHASVNNLIGTPYNIEDATLTT